MKPTTLIKMLPCADNYSDPSFGRLIFIQERTDEDEPIEKDFDLSKLPSAGMFPCRYGYACADWQEVYIDEDGSCWTEERMT